jgi:hypothetical protein
LFEQPAESAATDAADGADISLKLASANQICNGNGLTSTIKYVLLDASQELFHPLPCGSESACLISELESDLTCPEQLPVDSAATEYTSTDPDAPLDTGQKLI